MKTKRIFSLALVLVMLFSAFAVMPTASALTENVSLYYAKATYLTNPSGTSGAALTGYVQVKNLAYAKNVTIHYTSDNVTWLDCEADFYSSGDNNTEFWKFTTPTQMMPPYKSSVTFNFAIKYEVNGQVYWDNNNGSNYTSTYYNYQSSQNNVLGSAAVVLDYASLYTDYEGVQTFNGSIAVNNYAMNKAVKVRYTTDNWATYTDLNAAYLFTYTNGSVDIWNFSQTIDSSVDTIQFAVCYTVNGNEYWDNNFGANYVVTNS